MTRLRKSDSCVGGSACTRPFDQVMQPLVVIESPLAGDVRGNVEYADALMLDSLLRGEAPVLGHLLFTRVLNDANPEHRRMGINAHLAVLRRASYVVIGMDLGISKGMREAIAVAIESNVMFVERYLGQDWRERFTPTPTEGFFR
jgi:hypothetical protein